MTHDSSPTSFPAPRAKPAAQTSRRTGKRSGTRPTRTRTTRPRASTPRAGTAVLPDCRFPRTEIHAWADSTAERFAATAGGVMRPRILEIGCGTGMLLFRLAPHCEQYVGVDFSASALAYIQSQLDVAGTDQRRRWNASRPTESTGCRRRARSTSSSSTLSSSTSPTPTTCGGSSSERWRTCHLGAPSSSATFAVCCSSPRSTRRSSWHERSPG